MRRVKRLSTAWPAPVAGRHEGQEVRDTLNVEQAYDAFWVVITPSFITPAERLWHARSGT